MIALDFELEIQAYDLRIQELVELALAKRPTGFFKRGLARLAKTPDPSEARQALIDALLTLFSQDQPDPERLHILLSLAAPALGSKGLEPVATLVGERGREDLATLIICSRPRREARLLLARAGLRGCQQSRSWPLGSAYFRSVIHALEIGSDAPPRRVR